jgi:hypothetical protein
MKNVITTALAVGAFASIASADWTDYYSIGYAGPNGIITHPQSVIDPAGGTAYQTALTPVFAATQGVWTFATDAPPTTRRGQFQRTPGLTGEGSATGFSLTVLGTAANPGGGLASFTIASPETVGFTDHVGNGKTTPGYGYSFSWNLIDKPGTTAWWVDAAGTHFFDLSNDTGSEFFADSPGVAGDLYGFYIQGEQLNTLQIQGWQPVPEPSSIVMGLVTLVGAAGFGYRRFRSSKA